MRTIQIAALTLGLVLAASPAYAKRLPPKPVHPVRAKGVEFTVPHAMLMGLVVATDIKSGTVLWRRQIYTVRIDPAVEEDAQWSFITGIKTENGCLIITNESGCEYSLNLKTLQVHAIKGNVVVQWEPHDQ
ncbi:hypothetical protein [Geothrix sp. 21YS21S-2]|uniref:hypothetical protein n=1 Tax=Geothrix sp. 21YS21S-2 TaxID=3068893 RepID=UPI0027BB067E|nr:hypothetical protein [Geothrix sp. 21YS21S-2]